MISTEILSKAVSVIEAAIAVNIKLKNENLTLKTRIEELEKQLKEHQQHSLVMQFNNVILKK